jgi:hypothetical protein
MNHLSDLPLITIKSLDLAIVRRSVERLATNQDQLARKQDQMAQTSIGVLLMSPGVPISRIAP